MTWGGRKGTNGEGVRVARRRGKHPGRASPFAGIEAG